MAIITKLGVDSQELQQVAAFMESNGRDELPEGLSELAKAIVSDLMSEQTGLWKTVIGRFTPYQPTGVTKKLTFWVEREIFVAPDGTETTTVDYLHEIAGDGAPPVRTAGVVVEDYVTPDDAFQVGVPC